MMFKFDCYLRAALSIEAENERDARNKLEDFLDAADVTIYHRGGDPIEGEASLATHAFCQVPKLYSVDGKEVT